jgi:GT2 family glycosyltransferase
LRHVSIIVVSWNAQEHLRNCLESIRRADPPCVLEVIVVDNASHDGSPEMVEREFPEVRLMRCKSNLGFGKANNLGMSKARGSMFALVNSDALVHAHCLETLQRHLLDHPEVALVAPRVIGADGNLQRTSRNLPRISNTFSRAFALDRYFPSLFASYETTPKLHEKLHTPEALGGCFVVARREAVRQIGGFDEQFFFYGEDIDWCKRFRDAGWKLAFVPSASATHFGGASSAKAPLRFSIEVARATLKYWRKHHGRSGELICLVLLILHYGFRAGARAAESVIRFQGSHDRRERMQRDVACLWWLLLRSERSTSRD